MRARLSSALPVLAGALVLLASNASPAAGSWTVGMVGAGDAEPGIDPVPLRLLQAGYDVDVLGSVAVGTLTLEVELVEPVFSVKNLSRL